PTFALVLHRRQRGVKLWYNMVALAAQTSLAAIVFHAVVGSEATASLRAMVAAVLASLTADLASAVFVTIAIAAFRALWPAMCWWALGAGVLASLAKTALALLAVRSITED